ncbi:MAG: hypothetical protein IT330_08170, partial [Anaerolineae bacterium]|nr:hypothetical protein [Anaerolineae bacterium]
MRVYLFSTPRLERDGVPVAMERRKAVALLAYLAVMPGPHGRDALATLLWPELDQQGARTALRHALVSLNKSIGKGWLDTDQDRIELFIRPGLWVDVSRFRALLAQVDAHKHPPLPLCDGCVADLTEAVALYRGDFLAGFTLRDTADFDAWQVYQTEGLHHELAGALVRLAQAQAARRDYDSAIATGRRWLALDPLCEPAHRALMRCYAWAGDRAAALHQYEECIHVLAEELGVEPETETIAWYDEIRGGGEERLPQPTLPGLPSAPLQNLPPDPTPFIGGEVELALVVKKGLTRRDLLKVTVGTVAGGISATFAQAALPTQAPETAQALETKPQSTPAAGTRLEGKTGRLWGLEFDPHLETYRRLAKLFQQKTGAVLNVEPQPNHLPAVELVTALAAGTQPDLACIMGKRCVPLYMRGALLPLGYSLYKEMKIKPEEVFFEEAVLSYSWKDE